MKSLTLNIITQEKPIFKGDVEAISVPATEGTVTILPGHIPLFTKYHPGEIRILQNRRWQVLVSAGGFMDVAPNNQVTVLADSAVRIDEISLARAEAAKKQAEDRLKQQLTDREFALVEADLRKAILELRAAHKHRSAQSF